MYTLTLTDYKWNWIDDGLLPYALAAMRAVWVGLLAHLWSRGLMPYRPDLIALPWVFGLLAISTGFAQLGVYVVKTNWRAILLIVLGGLGAIALTLYLSLDSSRPAIWEPRWFGLALHDPGASIVTLIIAVWLWWWGIRTGRERVHYDLFASDFAWGTLMLAFAGVIVYATRAAPLREVVFALIPFFAIGLATLAISNLQSTRRFEGGRADQALAMNRYWLGTVAAVIGVLLLAGLLLGQLFAPETIAWIVKGLAVVLQGLTWLLLGILIVVAYLIFVPLEWLVGKLDWSSHTNDQPLPNPPPSLAEQFKDLSQGHPNIPPQVYVSLQVLAGVLLVAVIVLIFALAFRRFKTLAEEDVEETREIILSMDLLKEQLAQLFGRKGNRHGPEPDPFVSIVGDDPRAQIRRTYQAMLAWAASQGMPRSPGQTSSEYLSSLSNALPAYGEPISILTAAYLQARYSAVPISSAITEQALRAWGTIARENGKDDRHNEA
jgi:hypothetical protein